MKKLLILTPTTDRGGAENYALTIAKAAVDDGWDVHVAFQKTGKTNSLIQDFSSNGVTYHSSRIGDGYKNQPGKLDLFFQFLRTLHILLKLKPDVAKVVLPYPNRGFGCIYACGFISIPTVVIFQLVRTPFNLSNRKLNAYAWAKGRNQKWIAVSDHNRLILQKIFNFPDLDLLRIYNGAQVAEIISESVNHEGKKKLRREIRNDLDVPTNSIIILTVGHLKRRKGHQDIVPIIPHVVRDFPAVKFVWAGDGPYREQLKIKINEYGVEDHVLLLGQRSEIPLLLMASDLFLFPTYSEGLPFSLIEAMAYELPVIASDSSSIPEILESGVHGLLFRTGDCCDLMESIRWALRHQGEMSIMAENAKLRVRNFSEEKMILETLQILEILAKGNTKT